MDGCKKHARTREECGEKLKVLITEMTADDVTEAATGGRALPPQAPENGKENGWKKAEKVKTNKIHLN